MNAGHVATFLPKQTGEGRNLSGALQRRLRGNYVITANFLGGKNQNKNTFLKTYLLLLIGRECDENSCKKFRRSSSLSPRQLRLRSQRLGSAPPGSASSAPHEVDCGEAQRTDALPFLILLILLWRSIPHGCGRMLQMEQNCIGSTGINGGGGGGGGLLYMNTWVPHLLSFSDPCLITVFSFTQTLFL